MLDPSYNFKSDSEVAVPDVAKSDRTSVIQKNCCLCCPDSDAVEYVIRDPAVVMRYPVSHRDVVWSNSGKQLVRLWLHLPNYAQVYIDVSEHLRQTSQNGRL